MMLIFVFELQKNKSTLELFDDQLRNHETKAQFPTNLFYLLRGNDLN